MKQGDMKQGDTVRVTAGTHAGEQGQVICVFQGQVTIVRKDNIGVLVPARDCMVVTGD